MFIKQHFEPSEVGILARCLCIPLVSIRVGKINKQGTLLCPTGTRYLVTSLLYVVAYMQYNLNLFSLLVCVLDYIHGCYIIAIIYYL